MLLHALDGSIVTPSTLWRSWRVEWLPAVATVVAGVLYALGVRRLRARAGRREIVPVSRIVACYAGLFTLLVALASPLDAVADSLFVGHMIQHTLLIAVAAPLIAYGSAAPLTLWGLGDAPRIAIGRLWVRLGLRRAAGWATGAFAAWLLHTLALWVWHLPRIYGAALESPAIHALEHISFFGTGVILWSVVFPAHRRGGARAAAALAGTFVQTGALGAFLTLSGTPWYYSQSAAAGAWGLTALQDQQLAGLVMWIPPSVIYVGAMLAIMRRWLAPRAGDTYPYDVGLPATVPDPGTRELH